MKPEILHLYAWDVAFEIPLDAARGSLAHAGEKTLLPEKAAPRGSAPERFLHLPLPAVQAGDLSIDISANLYSFGVVCLTLRYAASGSSLADFVPHHDFPLQGGDTLNSLARKALDHVLARIAPLLTRHAINPEEPEAYTIFRFTPEDLGLSDAATWLDSNRREAAALLTGESDSGRLSGQEVEETFRHTFSYYRDDLVVVDWEAALIVERGPAADVLGVFELANLQLVEYRHYDAELDRVVGRAYDDLERFYRRPTFVFGAGELLKDLREIRISLSEVAEEIDNATKFFGDWHLARQYIGCAARFHIPEWKASVEEKLKALDELYNLAATESGNRKMLILEVIIVILFVVDLVVLAFATK